MKRIIIPALAAMALAGCGDPAIKDAQTEVREQLVDSQSAQFENVVVQKTQMSEDDQTIVPVVTPAVCGWVNAKNRMGGYTGAERFLVKDGFPTFTRNEEGWAGAFAECVIHSDDKAANDRLTREGRRAIDAYRDAVDALNEENAARE